MGSGVAHWGKETERLSLQLWVASLAVVSRLHVLARLDAVGPGAAPWGKATARLSLQLWVASVFLKSFRNLKSFRKTFGAGSGAALVW